MSKQRPSTPARQPVSSPPGAEPKRKTKPAPFQFVPVFPDLAVHSPPVLHDGSCTADEALWSGEIRCTLRALTPLLAANDGIEWRRVHQDVRDAFTSWLKGKNITAEVDDAKRVIEPLALPGSDGQPGRLLIAGSALKGMVRASLQTLLSAPMERVQERTFSYRPSLGPKCLRPARILKSDERTGRPAELDLLPPGARIVFVEEEAVRVLVERGKFKNWPACGRQSLDHVSSDDLEFNSTKTRLTYKKGARGASLAGYVLLPYSGAIAGDPGAAETEPPFRSFAKAHQRLHPDEGGKVFLGVLYDPPLKNPGAWGDAVPVDESVWNSYVRSIAHLANGDHGHLRAHPLGKYLAETAIVRGIKAMPSHLGPDHLVYALVEQVEPGQAGRQGKPNKPQLRVLAIGHHFRFRHGYRDSVREAPLGGKESLRQVLQPLKSERENLPPSSGLLAGLPKALAAQRGLFGYVSDEESSEGEVPRGSGATGLRLGKGDFEQLAGRVAINMAVERNSSRSGRFVSLPGLEMSLVPLRVLASPKPSAVEHYLVQERVGPPPGHGGTLRTYGDVVSDKDLSELRGRKFYLHQPVAAREQSCFALVNPSDKRAKIGESFAACSQHAALARFVLAPGAEFGFTVRVRDLRMWELGALFLAMASQQAIAPLVQAVPQLQPPQSQSEKLAKWIEKHVTSGAASPSGEAPLLASKLGMGRPLGLGSVSIAIDEALRLQDADVAEGRDATLCAEVLADDAGLIQRAVKALLQKIHKDLGPGKFRRWCEEVLWPWLEAHRYRGRASYDYPTEEDKGERTILAYHSKLRVDHVKGRWTSRERNEGWIVRGLASFEDLEEHDGNPTATKRT